MGCGVYSVWKAVPSGSAIEVWSERRFERVEQVGGEIGNHAARIKRLDALWMAVQYFGASPFWDRCGEQTSESGLALAGLGAQATGRQRSG